MFHKYLTQIEEHDRINRNLLIPHDCLYFSRLSEFANFCNLIDRLIKDSGKSEKEVLLATKMEIEPFKSCFNLTFRTIEYVIEINTKES